MNAVVTVFICVHLRLKVIFLINQVTRRPFYDNYY